MGRPAVPDLTVRSMGDGDVDSVVAAYAAIGWEKRASQFQRYLAEQSRGEREVLLALLGGDFAGYLTVVWESGYAPFRAASIPEIVDFNVLPHLRRQGIGTRLLDSAEQLIGQRSPVAGIGVGMDADYGAAQRLYVKRGYVPDGRGLTSHGQAVRWGETVTVNDALVLCFTKALRPSEQHLPGYPD
jgi:GNAT superfamily N-acetyltransferase